jgi:hypothetical protein
MRRDPATRASAGPGRGGVPASRRARAAGRAPVAARLLVGGGISAAGGSRPPPVLRVVSRRAPGHLSIRLAAWRLVVAPSPRTHGASVSP